MFVDYLNEVVPFEVACESPFDPDYPLAFEGVNGEGGDDE